MLLNTTLETVHLYGSVIDRIGYSSVSPELLDHFLASGSSRGQRHVLELLRIFLIHAAKLYIQAKTPLIGLEKWLVKSKGLEKNQEK